uniref:Secreted protein n=1 Tax=Caenorhabditis tropicalis TaxID=1561998 RepID=A0A1I7V2R8_9PELO
MPRRNRPPRPQRFPPQPARNCTPVETIFLIFLVGLIVWVAAYVYENAEAFKIVEDPVDTPPNFADYQFDYEQYKERKRQLIEQAEREVEIAQNDERVRALRRDHLEKKEVSEIDEKFMSKWVPDPSRFHGIEEFLQMTRSNGTIVEEYFYMTSPSIQAEGDDYLVGFATKTQELLKKLDIDGCSYSPNSECHDSEIDLLNGDLYMYEYLSGLEVQLKITRVFYIPSYVLLEHDPTLS